MFVQLAKYNCRVDEAAAIAQAAAARGVAGGPAGDERPYERIPVVRELRRLALDASGRSKTAPRVADEAAKWLEWGEYLRVVESLRAECSSRTADGKLRSTTAIAWSIQTYLIFAILSCVPDRQRTIRELSVGTTLRRDASTGQWLIRHGAADYKTGKDYGERPPLVIAPRVSAVVDLFVAGGWRDALSPQHDCLFTMKNGSRPLSTQSVYRLFTSAAHRITGKRTNPHLVRDMIITHLRSEANTTERELEALALYMGHSLQTQRTTYDRRSAAQKVAPAVELLARQQVLDGKDGLGLGLAPQQEAARAVVTAPVASAQQVPVIPAGAVVAPLAVGAVPPTPPFAVGSAQGVPVIPAPAVAAPPTPPFAVGSAQVPAIPALAQGAPALPAPAAAMEPTAAAAPVIRGPPPRPTPSTGLLASLAANARKWLGW